MALVFLMLMAIVMLVAGIAIITTYSTKIEHSLAGIVCVFGAGIAIITVVDIHKKEQPKTMTINYEFRDSVYVPIDTVINNN